MCSKVCLIFKLGEDKVLMMKEACPPSDTYRGRDPTETSGR